MKLQLQIASIFTIAMFLMVGCATPMKSNAPSIIVRQPLHSAHRIVLDVLLVMGVEITKNEDFYIEGFLPAKGFYTTYWKRGVQVSVWIEAIEKDRTKICVDTAKRGSLLLGSSDPSTDILNEIKRISDNR